MFPVVRETLTPLASKANYDCMMTQSFQNVSQMLLSPRYLIATEAKQRLTGRSLKFFFYYFRILLKRREWEIITTWRALISKACDIFPPTTASSRAVLLLKSSHDIARRANSIHPISVVPCVCLQNDRLTERYMTVHSYQTWSERVITRVIFETTAVRSGKGWHH